MTTLFVALRVLVFVGVVVSLLMIGIFYLEMWEWEEDRRKVAAFFRGLITWNQ